MDSPEHDASLNEAPYSAPPYTLNALEVISVDDEHSTRLEAATGIEEAAGVVMGGGSAIFHGES
jgi:hypothetical protein